MVKAVQLFSLFLLAGLQWTCGQGQILVTVNPSNPFSADITLSVSCAYDNQMYTFDSFVHPSAGHIDITRENYRIVSRTNDVTLQMLTSSSMDGGTYFCLFYPRNGGDQVSGSINLQFMEAVVIDTPPTSYEAFVGESQTLVCDARHAQEIEWRHLDTLIPEGTVGDRIRVVDGYLVFSEVILNDSGTYTCRAGNTINLEHVDAELTVVQRPSTEVSPMMLKVDKGDSAVFTCIVEGFPLPSVKWVEVSTGFEISDPRQSDFMNMTVIITRLMFNNVTSHVIGSYKCMATSDYGTAESRVILDLVGTLGAIQDVVLTLVNHTNISVSWSAPVDSNVLSYTVVWQSPTDTPKSFVLDGPGPPTHHLIEDLERLTPYSVFVYATNERGRGVDSEQMNITTDAIAPSGLGSLSLFDISPTSVQVEWDLSSVDDGGSVVTVVRLSYAQVGGAWESVEVDSDQPVVIPGLTFGTDYQLRAQPGNRIGFGPLSTPINFTTSPEGYPGTPSRVSVFPTGSSSLLVCWEPSNVGGPFVNYNIEAHGKVKSWTVSVSELVETEPNCTVGAMIDNLESASCYNFTVSVTNTQGTGYSSALSNEACTLSIIVATLATGEPSIDMDTMPIIIASVVVGVSVALVFVVFVLLCCCCCLKLKQKNKYNLPERRESSRSDAAFMTYQHQSSVGNSSILTRSSSSEDSPCTATSHISNTSNPFVYPTQPQMNGSQVDPQFYYNGSNTIGPLSTTSGSTMHQLHPHTTHSLPHHTYNPHAATNHALPTHTETGFEMMTDNPYYKRFKLQKIPEDQEHINYAYVPREDIPPPLPPPYYSTCDDTSSFAGSEGSSLPIGESYSQPSYSPKLKHNKHKPSPSNNTNQLGALQTHPVENKSSSSFHVDENDGTEFIDNNAYEMIPPVMDHYYGNVEGGSYQGGLDIEEESEPRFEIKSQERGAVFETVQFKV